MNRRIIWGGLFLFSFLLFYCWMPVGLIMTSHMFFGLTGGVITAFFFVQMFADFRSWDELNSKLPEHNQWYHKVAVIAIVLAVALGVTFSVHYGTLEDNEIKEYGVRVPGTITAGYSKSSSKGGTTYNLSVSFYTKKGKYVYVNRNVDGGQYDQASIGKHVEVMYSQKHPTLVKILLGEDVVEEFTGFKSRDITVSDLSKILTMRKDSILQSLNQVSYRWELQPHETNTWVNNDKELAVFIQNDNEVTYAEKTGNFEAFKKNALSNGFKPVLDTDSAEIHLFEKDSLILMLQTKASDDLRARIKGEKALIATLGKK
ncbi:DUF3592 domain-containing protein [Chitinophaga tropicalis]|uniref:DUF3592 domain-containing protein n=1 Tax=Chitinophaga tropicalis TaxID=2683588 RepID=A0A7K1U3V7_9BACT|nr:DUF3592 domain-containing protein [Chitinophaga tropicalis]MVT09042.1 DUF3592 domain-containing protein [Chitinophaga tropicalis]